MKPDILDSSAWLECLGDGPNTPRFRPVLLKLPALLIPSIVITEVRRLALTQQSTEKADEVTLAMHPGIVVPIDGQIAAAAADLFLNYKLPLAKIKPDAL